MGEVLLHYLATLVCVVVGIPWAKYLFASMPQSMVGMARPLGFVIVGVTLWTTAMIGLVPFNGGGVLVIAAIMAYVGYRLSGGIDKAWVLAQWRSWALSELFFLIALMMVVFIRGHNPDPWGTERPMDYAFFNSIMNSPSFPPLDPWMSGFTINYYYAGYVLAAIPAVLTASDPVVSYNLALATTAGMSAAAVVTVVVGMVQLWRPSARPLARGEIPVVATLAFVALLVVGNMGGFLQVVSGVPEILALESGDIVNAVKNGLGAREPVPLRHTFKGWEYDGTSQVVPRDTWQDFNWWNPSRAIWDSNPAPDGSSERRYAITEFPFFSYWLGDMHPHVMSLPFVLLLLALIMRRALAPMPDVLIPGLLLGLLYPLNSWDYPTYMLLYGAALVWQSVRVGRAWREIAIELASVVVASYVWYLPFHLTFYSLVGGADPLVDIPLVSTLSQFFGIAPARTEFHGLFIMFGLFIVPIVVALWRLMQTRNEQLLYAATMVVALVGAFTGFTTLAAIPWLALVLYIVSTRTDLSAPVAMWLAIATIAALLCLAVDVVYIRDVFSSRMNTVFKFYYQVWVLWSIAAVLAGWYIWHTGTRALRIGMAVVVVPLLAAALVYPAATLGKQLFNARDLNLAGRTPRDNVDGGPESITWLRENAPNGSVIIEAIGGQYDIEGRGFGGVSASTGLPAVLGWPGHEDQWRGGHAEAREQIGTREQDVRAIYSSGDEALVRDLVAKYKIRYIYVGPTERTVYGDAGIALFDAIGKVAFQAGEITIYDMK